MKTHKNAGRGRWTAVLLLAVLLLAGAGLFGLGYRFFLKQAYPLKYTQFVSREAAANDLDPAFVYSVIRAESNFDPNAVSHAGAVGLMQLTPDTFSWLQTKLKPESPYSERDLLTPEINIRYGCRLLAILLEKYSDRKTALSAYNAGIGTVNGWLKDRAFSRNGTTLDQIPYEETRNYVDAVLKNYGSYRSLYQFDHEGEKSNGENGGG